jgi:predicted DNA-binding transcriptional regulator YafY
MTTNQTARVLELLRRFNNGEKVCIEALQKDEMWIGDDGMPKSERTIKRDFVVLNEYFPNAFELIRGAKGERSCYKALTNNSIENLLNPETLSLLVQTFSMAQRSNLFEMFQINSDDKNILEKKISETNKLYSFKNKPFETKKDDFAIFKALESAIKFQKYINITYTVGNEKKVFEVKPYKIVFMQENFYLACEIETETLEFAMYRISKITTIEDTRKTYQRNPQISDFIDDIQTPFARYSPNYKSKLIEVLLEVDSSKAFFFKAKNHLKSQRILETKENGNVLVQYKVTQEMEVDQLIKSWLPNIRIIAPISLKEKIEGELRAYLEK